MARKSNRMETRIWSFRIGKIDDPEGVREALFQANRYANRLIEIERRSSEAYRAIRSRHYPALAEAEREFQRVETEIETAFQAIRDWRAKQYRRDAEATLAIPEQMAERCRELKDERSAKSAKLKEARSQVEKLLGVARAAFKERKTDLTPDGAGARTLEKINAKLLGDMLDEPEWPAAWKELARREAERVVEGKAARAARPVGVGTGGLAEETVQQAVKDARPAMPRFRRFSGTGRVGEYLKNATFADVIAGKNRILRLRPKPLDPTKRGTGLRADGGHRYWLGEINIGCAERRKDVWVSFEAQCHRAIPENAWVRRAWIKASRTGRRTTYELQLTLEGDEFAKPVRPAGNGRVAVNFGWRDEGSSVRVATWLGDDGQTGVISISKDTAGPSSPSTWQRLTYPSVLRSRCDRYRVEFCRAVSKILKVAGHRIHNVERDSRREDRALLLGRIATGWAESIHGAEHLRSLWAEWKKYRDGMRGDYFCRSSKVKAWRVASGWSSEKRIAFWCFLWARKDDHMRQLAADSARRAENIRDHQYRLAAIRLATQYGDLVTDNSRISDIVKRPELVEEHDGAERSRTTRQLCAPGRCREIMREVFGKARDTRVDGANATVDCADCGAKTKATDGAGVACPVHGRRDRDTNNCMNLLKRCERSGGDETPGSSRDSEKHGEHHGADVAAE